MPPHGCLDTYLYVCHFNKHLVACRVTAKPLKYVYRDRDYTIYDKHRFILKINQITK